MGWQVTFLDHYDSFSFNLIDWLFSDTDLELVYRPFDASGLLQDFEAQPRPLILSPGPLSPDALPQTMALLAQAYGRVPVWGICLGHQCLGQWLGGRIIRARAPFHGLAQSLVIKPGAPFVGDLPASVQVARYNSLVVEGLPESLITAWNPDSEIEAIEDYRGRWPAFGVQFHPESFLSLGVESLKEKWLDWVRDFYRNS